MLFLPLTPYICGSCGLAVNSLMLFFNVGFTRSKQIATLDSDLMSAPGQFLILLWGAAYYAAGMDGMDGKIGHIWLVFAAEKAFYVYKWGVWNSSHNAFKAIKGALASSDKLAVLAPLFHATYGSADLVLGLMFLQLWRSGQ